MMQPAQTYIGRRRPAAPGMQPVLQEAPRAKPLGTLADHAPTLPRYTPPQPESATGGTFPSTAPAAPKPLDDAQYDDQYRGWQQKMQSHDYGRPQNIGEGLTAIGEAIRNQATDRYNRTEARQRVGAQRTALDGQVNGLGGAETGVDGMTNPYADNPYIAQAKALRGGDPQQYAAAINAAREHDQRAKAWPVEQRNQRVQDAYKQRNELQFAEQQRKAEMQQRYQEAVDNGLTGEARKAYVLTGKLVDGSEDPTAKLRSQVQMLQERGYQPDQIKQMLPQMMGIKGGDDGMSAYQAEQLKLEREKLAWQQSKPGKGLTPTEMKFVEEADDKIVSGQIVLDQLDEALRINDSANAGWFAGARASIANNLYDSVVPDFISSPKGAHDTDQLSNIVTGQMLAQLKTTFGAAPTEGEREILEKLQGSIGESKATRRTIFNNAKALASFRINAERAKAEAMRSGSYFQPGGAAGLVQPLAPAASPRVGVSDAAAAFLRNDPSPEAVSEFDAKFGSGAAQRVLNGQ